MDITLPAKYLIEDGLHVECGMQAIQLLYTTIIGNSVMVFLVIILIPHMVIENSHINSFHNNQNYHN